ncbi:uncharacterized protein BJ212DRAFT_1304635 [Suillus subaureus]|uniref:Uncharacterized protein n=1 Tax=Suillus subaureus TaxID=48587 RepID=A0A9P7DU72_9AGAM|nr:uncharacterized protein BJ212DRAFT_1304635 [Suillus subaureus]KAG1803234.1 hypothetical protein BJ212DRAFT_1304635 [Suillus subaureus]
MHMTSTGQVRQPVELSMGTFGTNINKSTNNTSTNNLVPMTAAASVQRQYYINFLPLSLLIVHLKLSISFVDFIIPWLFFKLIRCEAIAQIVVSNASLLVSQGNSSSMPSPRHWILQDMDFFNLQNKDEMLIDEHESQIMKTGEMDDVSLNNKEAILIDQDITNNDMDMFSLDKEDVMLIDQDGSNNGDMDVFSLDKDDVMNIDEDEIMV